MNTMAEYTPSTKAKIRNNVLAVAAKVGRTQGAVWRQLYDNFEYVSNTPWRKLAHNQGTAVLEAVFQAGKLESMLECAQALAVEAGLAAAPKQPEGTCVVCGQELDLH